MLDLATTRRHLRAVLPAPLDLARIDESIGHLLLLSVPGLASHSVRVAEALRATSSLWAVPPGPDLLAAADLLHDLGKILLPRDLLLAPRALTPGETARLQRHPVLGLALLPLSVSDPRLLDAVAHHHERWDGEGYPLGLRGTQIPFIARVLAIVDALDAMTSPRPYRPARTRAEALAEVQAHAGTQFDPDLAVACRDLFETLPIPEPIAR